MIYTFIQRDTYRKVISLLLFIGGILSFTAEAQSPKVGTIRGRLEVKGSEDLEDIAISLDGTKYRTLTDDQGNFELLGVPYGIYRLNISSLFIEPEQHKIVLNKPLLELRYQIKASHTELETVVVTGASAKRRTELSGFSVNVLELDATSKLSLSTSEVLDRLPGTRIRSSGGLGSRTNININGMSGESIRTFINGVPQSSYGGSFSLRSIPSSMIERVEVMRGGGSALFGSSAIAGTINIITKEPLRNSGQLSHTITSVGGSSSFDNNTSLNASLVTDDHRAGLYIFGQNRHRSGYDYDGDGFTELPELKNQTVGFRSYLKTSTYSKLTFEYHHMQEFRRGGDMLDRPPHEAHIAEQLQHSIDGGSLKYDYFSPNEKNRLSIFASAANTDRDSYYGPGNDPLKAYGKTTDLIAMGGAQYVHTFDKCLFMPSDLTAGLEYNRDRLKDNMWGYDRHTDQTVNIYSAFLQNEWKNERWSILVGGRLDKHNMVDNIIFSPRANLRFNPTQNINLRLSYSSGFRAPQAFDEDMHIENVGGTVAMIERAKNLKEEKSQSFSASADIYHRFGAFQTNFLIEGFYTKLTDVFVLGEPYNRGDGVLVKLRSNGPGAKVVGVTLEGKLAYLSLLQVQAGLTLQRSRYDEPHKWHDDVPAKRTIFRTPNVYGYFTATYIPIKPLSIALSGTYTGSMFVQRMDITAKNAAMGDMPERKAEAVKTPKFLDLGVKLAYDFKLYKTVDLQLSGGVQNILEAYQKDFDKGASRDSGYIYG
ncbi:TonB-dependent receptor, partial [uncultured Porphyromonas sp.]|uniref:TonB-dependent receptor n=1 Tax=uncultured Porphyromonas sp. TaxID=159274 RepID=UPI00342E2BF2